MKQGQLVAENGMDACDSRVQRHRLDGPAGRDEQSLKRGELSGCSSRGHRQLPDAGADNAVHGSAARRTAADAEATRHRR